MLGLLAGCKKKAPEPQAPWVGIPAQRACGHWCNNVATCVADGEIYTCVADEDQGIVQCAPKCKSLDGSSEN